MKWRNLSGNKQTAGQLKKQQSQQNGTGGKASGEWRQMGLLKQSQVVLRLLAVSLSKWAHPTSGLGLPQDHRAVAGQMASWNKYGRVDQDCSAPLKQLSTVWLTTSGLCCCGEWSIRTLWSTPSQSSSFQATLRAAFPWLSSQAHSQATLQAKILCARH